jgi:hypothetical protein
VPFGSCKVVRSAMRTVPEMMYPFWVLVQST